MICFITWCGLSKRGKPQNRESSKHCLNTLPPWFFGPSCLLLLQLFYPSFVIPYRLHLETVKVIMTLLVKPVRYEYFSKELSIEKIIIYLNKFFLIDKLSSGINIKFPKSNMILKKNCLHLNVNSFQIKRIFIETSIKYLIL